MTNFTSVVLPPWSPPPYRIEQTFKKTINHSKRYSIHKAKENNASISPSMCFSASIVIDGMTVNGLLLVVEAFTMFFDQFFLILFLQREANYKRDNTDNSENVIKVCQ
jgi:hypothetical protein